MTDKDLELKLARALEQTAPKDAEGVLSRCEARKGTVISMKKTTNRPRFGLIAACLALVLLVGGGGAFYQQSHAVASVVSLDVNPSIEMTVNRKETVISCVGLNEEAAIVLEDYSGGADLKGVKLKVAVNALVGSMLNKGYLNDLTSAILISVEDKDGARAARLQQELAASVDVTLQEASSQAGILSQTVTRDPQLEQQAQAHNISTGKAALVERVRALNGALDFEQLSALSVEELKDLIEIGAPAMPIGREEALRLATEYAGVTEISSVIREADPELDEFTPYYEVELRHLGREYEYVVDAFTGEILRGPQDILNTPEPTPAPSADPKKVQKEQALDLALADLIKRFPELSGYNIFDQKVTLDRDDGREHYDIEFWIGGYEVDYEIDAETGTVLEWDTDYEGPAPQPDPTPQPAASSAPTGTDIGKDAALTAALNHAGLSTDVLWSQVEQDYDDGRLEYEVEFYADGIKYEYTIDAATGAILERDFEYEAPNDRYDWDDRYDDDWDDRYDDDWDDRYDDDWDDRYEDDWDDRYDDDDDWDD